MELKHFHNLHEGETILLVGNGKNLHLTPPAWFDYPSIGMNTIHKYEGWAPTYYVAVDHRMFREFGEEINQKYSRIDKFIPSPNLDMWQGENFVRWYHRPGDVSLDGITDGMTYSNVMHVAMQLAYWMGAAKILMIGVHHKPGSPQAHFWGEDAGIKEPPPIARWFADYCTLSEAMYRKGVEVLNISEDTHVATQVLPRGDWRNYESKTTRTLSGFNPHPAP